MILVLAALVFVATFGLVLSGYALLDRGRLQAASAARARLRRVRAEVQVDETVRLLRRAERLSGFRFLQRALEGRRITESVSTALHRAGVRRSVGEFVLASIAVGAAGLALGTFALGPAGGLLAAAGGALVPRALLGLVERRRLSRLEAQLPELLDMLVNSLRSGYSFPAALEFAAGEIPAPLGAELARARDEQRLGIEARAALEGLADRVPTSDMRMLVTAVLIQRETGGNLSELLADLAALVRERAAFRGKVAALTAEPRMSALVLALLPVVFFLLLLALNPAYVRPMLVTTAGHLLLGFAVVASTVGYVIMRRIGAVEL